MSDYMQLPENLPVPVDDGAADHLRGLTMPSVTLTATEGGEVDLGALRGLSVIYIYPMTGTPGVALPEGWDEIPGARGCTPETCGFRDHFAELRAAGADAVYGLSTQDSETQREFAERTRLPFALLADPGCALDAAVGLPSFTAGGATRYSRLTLIIADGLIEHVFYPVFPPNAHAADVLAWLTARRSNAGGAAL
ncbi:MAG TPA: peroxiredoxin [Solirubrobacteraceae bacterium]|nr:peroxiredoxin [Solirubrobacteraceae bacterium]